MNSSIKNQTAFETSASENGLRLDVVLVRGLQNLGRARAQALIDAGKVLVNGRVEKKSYAVRVGDVVTVDALLDDRALPDPSVAVDVVLENENYVIVNKPSGLATHPISEGGIGTLVNGLLAKYPEIAGVGYHEREPGVVHRLDTFTSGLLLVARNKRAFEALLGLLKDGAIEKKYFAMCHGAVRAPQEINWPLYPDKRHPDRVKAWKKEVEPPFKTWPAQTSVLQSTQHTASSLVELSAHRAFRHQLRVHLATEGHPIVGDTIYGEKGDKRPDGKPGHMLHASAISFVDPWTYERVNFSAPTPWGIS